MSNSDWRAIKWEVVPNSLYPPLLETVATVEGEFILHADQYVAERVVEEHNLILEIAAVAPPLIEALQLLQRALKGEESAPQV